MKSTLLFFRYYNLFGTLFSILTGVSLSNAYSYKGIIISIFKEISDKGFTIGNLAVASALVIIIKVVIIRKEFIIFEFISN